MNIFLSHDFKDESFEAKTKWFSSLTEEERIEIFCEFIEFLTALNPKLLEKPYEGEYQGTVKVLRK